MAAKTVEIPKERWSDFVELVNHQSTDRWVRVEVESGTLGHQELSKPWPLRGLAYETKGSGKGALELTVGAGDQELTHVIPGPERLYVLQDEAGELQYLAVMDAGGGRTLVSFEAPLGAGAAPDQP